MTTATAPERANLSWDVEPIGLYTTPGHLAGGIAWEVLTHDRERLADWRAMRNLSTPTGFDHEDVWDFLFDVIGEAGRIGYLMGKIDVDAFAVPGLIDDAGTITTEHVAKGMAALMGIDLDEKGLYPWKPGDSLYEPTEDGAS